MGLHSEASKLITSMISTLRPFCVCVLRFPPSRVFAYKFLHRWSRSLKTCRWSSAITSNFHQLSPPHLTPSRYKNRPLACMNSAMAWNQWCGTGSSTQRNGISINSEQWTLRTLQRQWRFMSRNLGCGKWDGDLDAAIGFNLTGLSCNHLIFFPFDFYAFISISEYLVIPCSQINDLMYGISLSWLIVLWFAGKLTSALGGFVSFGR